VIELRVFGEPALLIDGAPASFAGFPRLPLLLAYLALADGRVRRDQAAFALWPDDLESSARANLRRCLHRLQILCGGEASGVEVTTTTISCSRAGMRCDAWEFEELLGAGEPSRDAVGRALEIYRTGLLARFENEWIAPLRERFQTKIAGALSAGLELAQRTGDGASLHWFARRLLSIDPFREDALRVLMSAQAAAGDRAGALAEYRLFERRLRAEFDVEPDSATTRLYNDLAKRDATPRRDNLPAQLSSFIGRRQEFDELAGVLGASRLITIAGSGGIGKTRLALELCARCADAFEDGVWWVPLGALEQPELVVHALARALAITEVPTEPAETTVVRSLHSKQVLLLLDSAEHLLASTTALVKTLLQQCPRVKVLVTARQTLHLPGEHVYRIGPIAAEEARRLFLERARAVDARFAPASDDENELTAICNRLEGIPLALELAAARITALSLRQIRERLEKRLAFLASPTAEEDRHRTLRGTIAWSYELLSQDERSMLGALSVFSGGFTLEACESVVRNPDSALDALESLVDKSFLYVRRLETEARYRMLDVLCEFAADEAGERHDEARAKHFAYFAELCIKGRDVLHRRMLSEWVWRIGRDIANIRSALAYGFEHHEPLLGPALCGMYRYWELRRTVAEGISWLQRYADTASGDDPCLRSVLRHLATFANISGDDRRARDFAENALARSLEAGDVSEELHALHALARIETRHGSSERAEDLYALISERCAGSQPRLLLVSNANRAVIRLQNGELEHAQTLLTDALAQCEQISDDDVAATIVALNGSLAYRRGLFDEAEECFERAIALKLAVGNEFGVAEITAALAALSMKHGNLERANSLIAESLETAVALDDAELAISVLEVLAGVFLAQHADEDAVEAFALSSVLRKRYCLNQRMALGREETERYLLDHCTALLEPRTQAAALDRDWKAAAAALLRAGARVGAI
jgi:predicted ATPase/DNA-binding SARP family transcriptional activator